MPEKNLSPQIPFRYRNFDSPTGVTRETTKRLAERLDVDEIQVIHLALRELAVKILPQYGQDDDPLNLNNAAQVHKIKKLAPPVKKKSVRSSLLEPENI